MSVRLLLSYLPINRVEHLIHEILLCGRSYCRSDEERMQDQADSPDCDLIHPVLRSYLHQRAPCTFCKVILSALFRPVMALSVLSFLSWMRTCSGVPACCAS